MMVQGTDKSGQLMNFHIQPTLIDEIKEAQKENPRLQKFGAQVEVGLRTDIRIHSDVYFILVIESVYHKEKFDRKFWQRHTVQLIPYTQEELKCIKT